MRNHYSTSHNFITQTLCQCLTVPRYGAVNILLPCCIGTAATLYCWRAVHNLSGLIGISIGWSVATGGLVSLAPLAIANLKIDTSDAGRRIGLGYTLAAFGGLLGNPIAGLARGARSSQSTSSHAAAQTEFQGVWLVPAGAITIATILLVATRAISVGPHMKRRI